MTRGRVQHERTVTEDVVRARHGPPVDARGEVVDKVDLGLVVRAIEGVVELGLLDIDRRVHKVFKTTRMIEVQV